MRSGLERDGLPTFLCLDSEMTDTSAPVSMSNSVSTPLRLTVSLHGLFDTVFASTTPRNGSVFSRISATLLAERQTDWKCPFLEHLWHTAVLAGQDWRSCGGLLPHLPQEAGVLFCDCVLTGCLCPALLGFHPCLLPAFLSLPHPQGYHVSSLRFLCLAT